MPHIGDMTLAQVVETLAKSEGGVVSLRWFAFTDEEGRDGYIELMRNEPEAEHECEVHGTFDKCIEAKTLILPGIEGSEHATPSWQDSDFEAEAAPVYILAVVGERAQLMADPIEKSLMLEGMFSGLPPGHFWQGRFEELLAEGQPEGMLPDPDGIDWNNLSMDDFTGGN